MFERLDRIHYDFVKNLMIFTKIHVFASQNWGEKHLLQIGQIQKLDNFVIKLRFFNFGAIWGGRNFTLTVI